MRIARLKRYQIDPLFRCAWLDYQHDCRFYPIDFEIRDQCISVCEGYFERAEIMAKTNEQLLRVFSQAKLVLSRTMRGDLPEIDQKEKNERRLETWIAKRIRICWLKQLQREE